MATELHNVQELREKWLLAMAAGWDPYQITVNEYQKDTDTLRVSIETEEVGNLLQFTIPALYYDSIKSEFQDFTDNSEYLAEREKYKIRYRDESK